MAFKASKEGQCIKCGKVILKGQYIGWSRKNGTAWHDNCEDVPTTMQAVPIPSIKEEQSAENFGSEIAALKKALVSIIGAPAAIAPINLDAINKSVDDKISAVVSEINGAIKEIKEARPQSIEIKIANIPPVTLTNQHFNFEKLVKLCAVRNVDGNMPNVYMHGPAGSGKSTAARKVAEVFGLKYGYVSLNPQTPESRLIGFIHAGGQYVPTEFFKRYTEGGVFCLDEIDNAASSLVCTLNSLLENGHGAFPHGIFERHKDFLCITTANTIGRGGNINYPERRALDSAFIDRFHFAEWAHDSALVSQIVSGILGSKNETDAFISQVDAEKERIQVKNPAHIVTPRAYIQGAILLKNGFTYQDIIDSVILRGVK